MVLTPLDLKLAKDVTLIVKTMVETTVAFFKNLKDGESKKGADSRRGAFKPRRGDNVNTVMLIGMEGVGKTELIKRCFQHQIADPTKKTEKFYLYTSSPSETRKCWINVADYAGQNVGMLVTKFLEHQGKTESPLKYGFVNSLIIVVDLREPEEDRRINATPQPTADRKRIKQNLAQWNDTSIDAIFGLLTKPALRYICVFVNKYDLVTNTTRYSKKRAAKSYAGLADYLRLKVPQPKEGGTIKVDVVVGSAKTGDGHGDLLDSIVEHCVQHGTA